MRGKPSDDEYSAEETARRLDATVRAMIATPPRPQKAADNRADKKRSQSARKLKKTSKKS